MESGRQFRIANLVLGAGILVYGVGSAIRDGLGVWTGILIVCGIGLLIHHVRSRGDATAVSDRDAWIATGCTALFLLGAGLLLL